MEKYIEQYRFIYDVLPSYGSAILINQQISDICSVKWLISARKGLFVILDKEGVTMLQKATDSLIVICHNILTKKYNTVEGVIDGATYLTFNEKDEIVKHFTFDVIAKPSYVLTATSDVFDRCLCVVDSENVNSDTTKRLIQRKVFNYAKVMLDIDLNTDTKLDWKIECEKMCEHPADYVFLLDDQVAFTLMFADDYQVIID